MVAHSKSPLIHNRAFQARRIDSVYLPFLVQSQQLGDWMKLAAKLPVCGFSVTIPHKQRIMRYLDVVDPQAKRHWSGEHSLAEDRKSGVVPIRTRKASSTRFPSIYGWREHPF